MSIAITKQPDPVSFSGDFINVDFQSADHLKQEGVKSVNNITIPEPGLWTSLIIVIQYGPNTIYIEGVDSPDNSGNQIPNIFDGQDRAAAVLPYFKLNPLLNSDFDISSAPNNILVFQAKKKGAGYDFKTYNVTPGLNDLLKDNYKINVRLFCQNIADDSFSEIYSANILLKDGTNQATALFGDKLHQRITADINNLGPEIPAGWDSCKISCRKYFFIYADSTGIPSVLTNITTSQVFTVIYGKQSFQSKGRRTVLGFLRPGLIDQDRFLKQGSAQQTILPDQPQYLYFFNTREERQIKVMVYQYFKDKTNALKIPYTITMKANSKYCFDVSPALFNDSNTSKYEVWLENITGEQVSEKQLYILNNRIVAFPRYFLNWSSLGAMDCRLFTGKGSSALQLYSQSGSRILNKGYIPGLGNKVIFDSRVTTTFKAATGFKSAIEIGQLTDFFTSDLKYRFLKGQRLPIQVTSNKIDQFQDANSLYALLFEYEYLYTDDAYSESDISDQQPGINLISDFEQNFKIISAGSPQFLSTDIIQQTL